MVLAMRMKIWPGWPENRDWEERGVGGENKSKWGLRVTAFGIDIYCVGLLDSAPKRDSSSCGMARAWGGEGKG